MNIHENKYFLDAVFHQNAKIQNGGLQHHIFLFFDGKQHPKNIWFRGC
jgi:hypothetical protein